MVVGHGEYTAMTCDLQTCKGFKTVQNFIMVKISIKTVFVVRQNTFIIMTTNGSNYRNSLKINTSVVQNINSTVVVGRNSENVSTKNTEMTMSNVIEIPPNRPCARLQRRHADEHTSYTTIRKYISSKCSLRIAQLCL